MAVLTIVAVKDLALDAFMRPFVVPHRGGALRSFSDEVNRADSEMAKHPEDYELYLVGEWHEGDGVISGRVGGPELLVRGKDCVKGTK